MRVEHVALWTRDLEKSREFYCRFFKGTAGEKYADGAGFESYFLTFDSGCRVELMTHPDVADRPSGAPEMPLGWVHVAFAVGGENAVDDLARELEANGYPILDGPRRTGDGYYEACLLDPDGNRLEITA